MDTESLDTFDGFIVATKIKDGKTRVLVELPSPISLGDGEVCQISVAEPMITKDQKAALHCLFRDIGKAKGMCEEAVKVHIKLSLKFDHVSKLTKADASNKMEAVLDYCLEQNVPLNHPCWDNLETRKRLEKSLHYKCCIKSGKKYGEGQGVHYHHEPPLGRGVDRRKVDPNNELPGFYIVGDLHSMIHNDGLSAFEELFHLQGLKEHVAHYYKRKEKQK